MIKLFDSKSKTKKVLTTSKNVTMYLCGPTVYSYVHIGNIRPVVVFDVLHRLLKHLNYHVEYVHNITDIDDKIIQQAQHQQTTEKEISEKYYQAYLHDLQTLNILLPTKMPKVTDFISQNIEFIERLQTKGYAYLASKDVYFPVDKIATYGQLAHKKIDKLLVDARVSNAQNKLKPFDFALWKDTKVGVNWTSLWGKGRPGWHTECAVFVDTLFRGQTINLHGGGIDLIFPHHENERAQMLALTNQELAHIWWHNGHINLDRQKMSKSLNNVVLVKDFCAKYHSFILRYLILNHDHHQPIDFTEALIVEAKNTIKKYQTILQLWSYHAFVQNLTSSTYQTKFNQQYYHAVINHLSDDLATTSVFSVISQMIKDLHQAINLKQFTSAQQDIFQTLIFSLEVLGFNFEFGNYDATVQDKIRKWEALKTKKAYQQADSIRQELQALGVLPKN